eukprot:382942-Amorphochlora_amoeboformis.AAC.1
MLIVPRAGIASIRMPESRDSLDFHINSLKFLRLWGHASRPRTPQRGRRLEMDSKNSFSTAESRRVYQTFPTYGNSSCSISFISVGTFSSSTPVLPFLLFGLHPEVFPRFSAKRELKERHGCNDLNMQRDARVLGRKGSQGSNVSTSSVRGFDTDDGETSDSRFGDSTYEFKNSLRKGIAEGEILEHELE